MMKRIIGGFAVFVLCTVVPLNAANLDDVISQAKQKSSTMQLLELSKEQSDIAMGLSEAEEGLSIEVFSGDVTFADSYGTGSESVSETNISASPSVVLTLPNDGNTEITIGVNPLVKFFDSNTWSASPEVSVSHTFTFGNTGDTLDDLKLAKQRLEVDQGYYEGVYDFENQVYQKIKEILEYEKTLLSSENEIADQKTKMANALTLKTTTKDSATYQSMELALAKSENTLSATKQQRALSKTQFAQMTTLAWEPVENIREADLSFSVLPTGDTSVVIAALAVEIANEELALEKQTDLLSLNINGGGGLSAVSTTATNVSYDVFAGTELSGNNFAASAQAKMNISNTGSLSPSLTISGSWKNNSASASDILTLQQLNNAVTIAGIDYQEAMSDYQEAAYQLQNDILSHQLAVKQLEDTITYDTKVLRQAEEAFAKGLGLQSAIDNARLSLDLDAYDHTVLMLEALVLENRAKTLQL